jgi:ParB-like chromosome segregation protein Spo0J
MKLTNLKPDSKNARKHTPRNIGMIEQALREVGAARSIVIDENGTVLAGNATIEAASAAGIERVRVIETDGKEIVAVRRTGLTPEQKTRLALYDNRTAELAEWDLNVLKELKLVSLDGIFDAAEVKTLLGQMFPVDARQVSEPTSQFLVVVTCISETEQLRLIERLSVEGFVCRALIS